MLEAAPAGSQSDSLLDYQWDSTAHCLEPYQVCVHAAGDPRQFPCAYAEPFSARTSEDMPQSPTSETWNEALSEFHNLLRCKDWIGESLGGRGMVWQGNNQYSKGGKMPYQPRKDGYDLGLVGLCMTTPQGADQFRDSTEKKRA